MFKLESSHSFYWLKITDNQTVTTNVKLGHFQRNEHLYTQIWSSFKMKRPLDQIRGNIDFYHTGVGKRRFTVASMRKFILVIVLNYHMNCRPTFAHPCVHLQQEHIPQWEGPHCLLWSRGTILYF